MSLRKTFLYVAVAAALGGTGAAIAGPTITIDGIVIPVGATFQTVNLFEGEDIAGPGNNNGVIDQVGEKLLGIGRVSLILDISNNIIWQNGQNGRELTFYLYDFVAEDISVGVLPGAPPLATAQIGFTGGVVEIYSQAVGTFDPSGTQAAGVTSATAGNLFLTLAGSAVGGFGSVSGAPLTLTSLATNATNGDPLLDSLNLSGQAFFDVTGGPAASNFDTNAFGCIAANGLPCPNSADVKLTSSGQLAVPTLSAWGFRGTGEAASLVIPEPGTLALLGVGLAGFGYRVRRKQD